MNQWQYGRLIVTYDGPHMEVRRKWLLGKKSRQVQGWTLQWFGPNGEEGAWQLVGQAIVPVAVLNDLGSKGWEVVAAFHLQNYFEYLLKRLVF